MKLKHLIGPLILATVIGLGLAVWLLPEGGDRAPSVAMTTLDGERFDLTELRGKPVLVTFWATNCPSCIAEMPHLVELHEEFHEEGFEIVGVAMHYDPPEKVERLVERRELPYRIVLDQDKAIMDAFGGVRVTPTSYLINPKGRIVKRKIGEFDTAELRNRVERML